VDAGSCRLRRRKERSVAHPLVLPRVFDAEIFTTSARDAVAALNGKQSPDESLSKV